MDAWPAALPRTQTRNAFIYSVLIKSMAPSVIFQDDVPIFLMYFRVLLLLLSVLFVEHPVLKKLRLSNLSRPSRSSLFSPLRPGTKIVAVLI